MSGIKRSYFPISEVASGAQYDLASIERVLCGHRGYAAKMMASGGEELKDTGELTGWFWPLLPA